MDRVEKWYQRENKQCTDHNVRTIRVQGIIKRRARKPKPQSKGILCVEGESKPRNQQATRLWGRLERAQGSRWEQVTLPSIPIPKFLSQTIVIQHRHPSSQEQSPHTCHSEPGACCKVEGRIIGTQLQEALVKPTCSPEAEREPDDWHSLPAGRILDYRNSKRHVTGGGREEGTQEAHIRANKKGKITVGGREETAHRLKQLLVHLAVRNTEKSLRSQQVKR